MLKKLYQGLLERMRKRYRVELIDDETLSQSRQFFLRPMSLALAGTVVLVLVVLGTSTLFVLTPALHSLIPNYEDPAVIQARKDSLLEVVKSTEARLEIYEAYSRSLRQVAGLKTGEMDFDSSQVGVLEADQQTYLHVDNGAPAEPQPSPEAGLEFQETQVPYEAATGQSRVETVYVNRPVAENFSDRPARQREENPGEWLQKLFLPLQGEMQRGYNPGGLHYGVDIVAGENTLIRAAADGFVILSEYSDNNGWVIGIATKGDIVTFYKHNSRLLKTAGTYVYAGEPVAVIGNSGENSSGMHLHFELWYAGKPVDPANYLAFSRETGR